MYKLGVYVPESHLDVVKQALFDAGAGSIGDYAQCCWQTLGVGQFCPASAANPFIGQPGQLEQVDEYRIELVMTADCARRVVAALRSSHPYEEPAFDLVKLVAEDELPD